MRCRVCFETVETYSPTGTNLLRAEQHPVWPGARADLGDCPGSYGPVDDMKSAERDRRRVQSWRQGDCTGYIYTDHHAMLCRDATHAHGPVDDEVTVEREKRRVQAWYGEVPQTADINDYLREKGERP